MPQTIDNPPKKIAKAHAQLLADSAKLTELIEVADAADAAVNAGQARDRVALYEARAARYAAEAELWEKEIVYTLAIKQVLSEIGRAHV
jgi:hypothetical protein